MKPIDTILKNLQILAKKSEPENKAFFKWLKTKKPADLDYNMQEIHTLVFKEIDCLKCANCCRSLGPRITVRDIERISKSLRLQTKQFIDQYLIVDEDNDYVFKTMPCPFLDNQNYCAIYEVRPQACKEYPHTDRRKFVQILDITHKNTFTCPAVFEAIEMLKKRYPR